MLGRIRWIVHLFILAFCLFIFLPGLRAQPENAGSAAPEAAPTADDSAATAPQGFFEIVFSGGPVGIGIMVCLIALSLTATYLIIEQAIMLRRKEILPEAISENVRQMLVRSELEEAAAICRDERSMLSFVLLHGMNEADEGWPAIEKSMEDALAEQTARLFRKVEYLSVIGNIAPMLGLLGTVVGMILCFQQVAVTQGSAGAPELAEGIYQALVTTVAGLMIAIPALGAFAIFRNRVDELAAEAAYIAQHALHPLKHRVRTTTAPPAPPPRR